MAASSVSCTKCQANFVPEPFPEQDDEDNGRFQDADLEKLFADFYFTDEVQSAKQCDGERMMDHWIARRKTLWQQRCKVCRYLD